jgi:hypothetical protein
MLRARERHQRALAGLEMIDSFILIFENAILVFFFENASSGLWYSSGFQCISSITDHHEFSTTINHHDK